MSTIEPIRRKVCTVCWTQKSIASFNVQERASLTGTCNSCLRVDRRHSKAAATKIRRMLKSRHKKKKNREQWVEWDQRDTFALEEAVAKLPDDSVESPHHIQDILEILIRAYGGIINMAHVMAVDLYSQRVPHEMRLRHHRLMLCIIAANAKLESARACEKHRLKLARAVMGSMEEDTAPLAGDDPAMHNAAAPIVALARHGMLLLVLEWCVKNGYVKAGDLPDLLWVKQFDNVIPEMAQRGRPGSSQH